MKIVCSDNMPFVEEAFGTLGDVVVLNGRKITARDVRDAEILAVRSTTRVNRDLLEGSRVRFVGTATIGVDHFDIAYMEAEGIHWCYAPGCNANSVSEYLVSCLLSLSRKHGFPLAGKTLGVLGIGNVGSRVVRKGEALGLRVLQNDPPKAQETGNPVFLPLDEILPQCDIVTLHVPVEKGGAFPTFRMAGERFFGKLKPGCIFVNAARGAVTDTDAFLRAMASGKVRHAVIDTWEGEPTYRRDLLGRVDLATPHIAGHSFEGKANGTVMVYQEACRFLGVAPSWSLEGHMPPPVVPEVRVDAAGQEEEAVLWTIVRRVYNVEEDDARLRATNVADDTVRARDFDRLRREYPMRREFPFTTVHLANGGTALRRKIAGLGFSL